MLKAYYYLTKPGIIYGNVMTTIAGFLLASKGHVRWELLTATVLGVALVIAAACVFNNYTDRGIDRIMARTKKRALATGTISGRNALLFCAALGVIGFVVLVLFTNPLTVALGVIAIIDYVALYGWSKRHSVHGTVVGSVSGALPLTAGYCAVSGRWSLDALLLFIIMVCWQMPHFYAIALRRLDEYAAAGLPVLPVKKGVRTAKIQIVWYIVAYIAALSLLTVNGVTGYTYALVMLALSFYWLWLGLQGFSARDTQAWARQVFLFSLVILLVFSIMISIDVWLP